MLATAMMGGALEYYEFMVFGFMVPTFRIERLLDGKVVFQRPQGG